MRQPDGAIRRPIYSTLVCRLAQRVLLQALLTMPTANPLAETILERMEPDRGYEAEELRAFSPEMSLEQVREVMQQLWVRRQVERFGYSGWRLCPSHIAQAGTAAPGAGSEQKQAVGPTK